jgi:hypothetical protein
METEELDEHKENAQRYTPPAGHIEPPRKPKHSILF